MRPESYALPHPNWPNCVRPYPLLCLSLSQGYLLTLTKRSKQAVNAATHRLIEAGIIRQTNQGKRSRVFEAPDVLEEFSMVERRLASPSRDTSVELPARIVPYRPMRT